MPTSAHPTLVRTTAALLLATCALGAQAHVRWGFDFMLGWPLLSLPLGQVEAGVVLPTSAVSVQFGGVPYRHYRGRWYAPLGLRWVLIVPPPGLVLPPPAAAPPDRPARPAAPPRPDPVIEPRNGQSAEQTEADRRDCNRWATTQPAAVADAAEFQRAVGACMDGRGYTLE